jgi:hypothetical protein
MPASEAKGAMMDQTNGNGGDLREDGHRKHSGRCKRDRVIAQHTIIDRCLAVGEVSAIDFDDVLPPAPSGSRTYVGTAFTDLSRAGIIRPADLFVTTAGRRHSQLLRRWRLAVDAAAAERHKAGNPIPEPEPES